MELKEILSNIELVTIIKKIIGPAIILSIISSILTYIVVIYLKMSWWNTLIIFTSLLIINVQIIEYIIPLDEFIKLWQIIQDTQKTKIFGVAIFALINVTFSISIAAVRFGLINSISLSIISALSATVIKAIIVLITNMLIQK